MFLFLLPYHVYNCMHKIFLYILLLVQYLLVVWWKLKVALKEKGEPDYACRYMTFILGL